MTKPRILIVEDNVEVAEMLNFFFSSHGYDVLVAYDGETAIRSCRTDLPSLVLLDVGLPDIDGFTVCRTLRQTARGRHLPVIFATKRDRKADKMEGLSLGADDFIAKPFDLEELFLRVQNAISRSARNSLTDPRTGLPALEAVRQEMARVANLPNRKTITFHLHHLDHFRDLYSSLAVTDVIRATALLLNSVLNDLGQADDFLGQSGDDTFVIICAAGQANEIVETVVKQFDERAHQHYSFGQREGEAVRAHDANNNERTLPILKLDAELS
ncbi:MAG: response regulator [Chloroflexi bacterium]|nr:response regulator [Chloroflexota bacterium]